MHHKVSGICLVRLKRSLKVAVGLSLHLALGRESKAGSLLPRPASPLRRSPASVTVALAKATTEESAVRPGYQSGCVPRPRIDKGVAELLRPSLPLPLPTYHSPSLSLSLSSVSRSLSLGHPGGGRPLGPTSPPALSHWHSSHSSTVNAPPRRSILLLLPPCGSPFSWSEHLPTGGFNESSGAFCF